MILKGKPVAQKVFDALELQEKPRGKFVAIQVGNDPVSSYYIEKKSKIAQKMGVELEVISVGDKNPVELDDKIRELNADSGVRSIMIQIPLPDGFSREQAARVIAPKKDIDGFAYIVNRPDFVYFPPTVLAIEEILNFYQISKTNKKILIVGEGFLVGQPLRKYWQALGFESEILNKDSSSYYEKIREADIVVLATGASLGLKEENFKSGTVVIDASTVSEDGVIKGDVEVTPASNINLAPVPGGVGPVTIAMLFKNFFN